MVVGVNGVGKTTTIGKLAANHKGVKLNIYYTPTVLTTNSLVFDQKLMRKWWKSGFNYAKSKQEEIMSEFRPDVLTDKEIEELCDNFEKDFSKMPKKHPLYLEVVKLLIDMGIELYNNNDEGDEGDEKNEGDEYLECYDNFNPMKMVEIIKDDEKVI
mgnify:CR=1 FL=1